MTAYITVWNMNYIDNMPELHKKSAVKIYKPEGDENIQALSIGLTVSPNGDLVAIYQEPKIGQWEDGSTSDGCVFQLCLLNPQQNGDVTVNFDEVHSSCYNRQTYLPHHLLKNFVGFGAFVTKARNNDWEMGAPCNTQPLCVNPEVRKCGKGSDDKTARTLFVACNGNYIDIFKIKPGHKWESTHTISLTDLIPTLSRRITCKMMMDVISRNTFMWLEDDGLCCTIWDLQKGSNVSYLTSTGNARFRGQAFRGNSKMAISPDESIIALARDGILTTYYAHTSNVINNRNFSGCTIEYIAFHGQNNQLFVIARNNTSLELSSWILDPLQLDSETKANQVPIPIIGRTVLGFFHDRGNKNKGLVCEADGGNINCYVTYDPVDNKVTRDDKNNLVDCAGTSYRLLKNDQRPREDELRERPQEAQEDAEEGPEDKVYEVKNEANRELFRDGDGSMYWVLHVEVIEMNASPPDKVVFSFVPEPWMRVSAAEIREPKLLQGVYFLPGRKCFVVAGMQTLQIWSLPTSNNPECCLVFIWSRPRTEFDSNWCDGKAYKTEPVGKYYHCIRGLRIYLDPSTRDAEAGIKLMEGSKMDDVGIPAVLDGNSRSTFFNCARSIHLLAAAYAYSTQMSKDFPKNSRKSTLTYEEHAKAITRFARSHINRLLPSKDFFPGLPTREFKEDDSMQAPIQITHDGLVAEPEELTPDQSAPDQTTPDRITPTPEHARRYPKRVYTLPTSTPWDPKNLGLGILSIGNSNLSEGTSPEPNIARRILDSLKFPRLWIWSPFEEYTWPKDVITILTLLLDQHDLKDANHGFVGGLLDTEGGEWVPHTNKALNPIKRAIECKDEHLLRTLIDYCVKSAKKHHAAYLIPAVQCLDELPKLYPDILCDLFRKASYIPAHNPEYIATHAIIANKYSWDWIAFFVNFFTLSICSGRFGRPKSTDISHLRHPIISIRSQLPVYGHVISGMTFGVPLSRWRVAQFPKRDKSTPPPPGTNRSRKIYVSPLQLRPILVGKRKKSVLAKIAGKDVFDSPAVVASLQFKWYTFGLYYWLVRFLVVLAFFILVLIVTSKQIHVSTSWDGPTPTPEELAARYLPEWQPTIIATIVTGLVLVLYEVLQFAHSPNEYIRSPYNYLDLAAYISPVVGCFILLNTTPGKIAEDTGIDGGPSQIWIMGLGIIGLYLNMLFELRVIRHLGITVNIIFNITRKIKWFILVCVVFLVSFTHAMLYVLHTRRYKPCKGDSCTPSDTSTYPTDFWSALSVTYFFLSGQYESVDTPLKNGPISFRVMMAFFFFFTAILLLNILIALMNDAFTECAREGEIAHWKLMSVVIAEVETYLMPDRAGTRSDRYPKYIYYCASEEEIKKFESSYLISQTSRLSPENRFIVEETQRTTGDDIKALRNELVAECSRSQDDTKQQLTEYSSAQEDTKQRLIELTELVKNLKLHLEAINTA